MVMKELAGSNGEFFHAVNADTWLEDQRNDINQPFSDAFLTRKPLTRTRTGAPQESGGSCGPTF